MTALPTSACAQPDLAPEEILARSLFRPMGVDGVYGRTGAYEDVVDGARRLHHPHCGPAGRKCSAFRPSSAAR